MRRLQGKKVLITGGSSGIGKAIALAYAKEGAIVAFTYLHNAAGAKSTLAEIEALGSKGYAFSANLAELKAVVPLVDEILQALEKLDILVNNAGTVSRYEDFLNIPMEAFEYVENLNLKTPFLLTQYVAKHMITQSIAGVILNISSMSAEIISPGLTHYECSKAGLNALTRAAASALAPYQIRVNAIAPGLVETSMNQAQRDKDNKNWLLRSSQIPIGRAGLPIDIAHLAVFLASDEAQWITGSVISIDGGLSVASPFKKG